ncbi:TPA: terminase gpA endonuclease subunit [Photobacterium damselae]
MRTETKITDKEIDFLDFCFSNTKEKKPVLTVVQWTEKNRTLPSDVTARPGKFKYDYTPFWIEVANNMSVSSNITLTAVLKGVQLGYTTAVLESVAGYYIDSNPAQIMLISASDTLVERTSNRIDHMIDNSGFRHKIFAQGNSKKKGQRSGDTVTHKEFAGGYLYMGSAQSPTGLRNLPARILLGDETDAWPHNVGKDGGPYELFTDRGNTFGNKKRQIVGSTPLIEATSITFQEYERGDQRRYHIKCLSCGESQPLEFFPDSHSGWGGISFERDDDGSLIESSVHYKCRACGHKMSNYDKARFLKSDLCEWVPMATPESPSFRSYQISSLYAPLGQITWSDIVRRFLAAKDDPVKLQVFYNNILGVPWRERGDSITHERLIENKIDYRSGEIPDDVLFLTITADIHKTWIGVEIIGWKRKGTSYSINWLEIEGDDCKDIDDRMWTELKEVILNDYRKTNGDPVGVASCFVDSGYSKASVFEFCTQFHSMVFPIKGDPQALSKVAKPYKAVQQEDYENLWLIFINTDTYKDKVTARMKLKIGSNGSIPDGYPFFPNDYEESYFKMYSAEVKVEKKSKETGQVVGYKWHKRNNNNHAFDCRVYNLCQLEFLANEVSKEVFESDKTLWEDFWDWAEDGGFDP